MLKRIGSNWVNVAQIIGALAAVGALLFAIVSFVQQKDKEIQVTVYTVRPLVDLKQHSSFDLQVFHKDQAIDNLFQVIVQVENDGNQAIREEDYYQPIAFFFDQKVEIVEASVLASSPSNLGIIIDAKDHVAHMHPVLLNPGDRAMLEFLVINLNSDYVQSPLDVIIRIAEIATPNIRYTATNTCWVMTVY